MAEYSEKFRVIRRLSSEHDQTFEEGDFARPRLCLITPGQSGYLQYSNPDAKQELKNILPNMNDLRYQTGGALLEEKDNYNKYGQYIDTSYYVKALPDLETEERMYSDVKYIYKEVVGIPPSQVAGEFTVAMYVDEQSAYNRFDQLDNGQSVYLFGTPVIHQR